jgi:hypothetical protein
MSMEKENAMGIFSTTTRNAERAGKKTLLA